MEHKIFARTLHLAGFILATITLATLPLDAEAADRTSRLQAFDVPDGIAEQRLPEPLADGGTIENVSTNSGGRQQVIVRLTKQARSSSVSDVMLQQQDFLHRCQAAVPGMRIIGRTRLVLNAVFIEVDADALPAIARDPAVARISRVKDYEMDLSETVPYIGAAAVQAAGLDGSGISVAILDSGVDYYHADLGGSGNPADYAADDPTIIEPGSFPTAKVVGGADFVGGLWPVLGPLAPDPDPLDDGPAAGHGTHVADITAGLGGVAPGADLYAVKVCSSVSPSCSGVALIQGMEFAVDPNGDGDPEDAVDIVNMSLGASYGQPFDDDLSAAVDNATELGVLTVASAGNSADKPYIVGTPSAAPTALSVAQTHVPSAGLQLITVAGTDYAAVFQPWSTPPAAALNGAVQYGDDDGSNLNGCAPFTGDLSGKIVLIDRGACFFSDKIRNVENAGGLAGIIGLVAPGGPFAGGFGGGAPIGIPGYMISQADSNAIKASVAVGNDDGTINPANRLPLVMSMVGSSSRGPSGTFNAIKPEIGAPGASVSAVAGTGTGVGPFGGTSGAAPMISGSAALVLQAKPDLDPAALKGLLINTADRNIDTDPFSGPAPITRIGGGEVRVDRAVISPVVALDKKSDSATLSFGQVDVHKDSQSLKKRKVELVNHSDEEVTYNVAASFRFPDDEATGAVDIQVSPTTVSVKPGGKAKVNVELEVFGALLPGNFMSSGGNGADPAALTLNEYDGYIDFTSTTAPAIHMPWQVLPRQAARVKVDDADDLEEGGGTFEIENKGVGTAQIDGYSLLGTSRNLKEGPRGGQMPTPDLRSIGVQTFPVPPGFCSAQSSFIWAFAVNTWERQQHLVPLIHNVYLDTNRDGLFDFAVFNFDLSFSGAVSDGRQVTWSLDLATGNATAFFFAEHAMNTANTVLYICGEQVGLSGPDLQSTNVDMYVETDDWYFGNIGSDRIGDPSSPITIAPLGERFLALSSDLPGNTESTLDIVDFGPFPGNSSEAGVLLITNGDRGTGARGGATAKTEAVLIQRELDDDDEDEDEDEDEEDD